MNPNVDDLLAQVQRQQEQVAEVQRAIEKLEIKAASRGDDVTVTLRGTGQVTEIDIRPEALRRYDAHELGQIVVEALGAAQVKLTETTKARFAPIIEAAGQISG